MLTHLPWFILVGKPGESSRAMLMGAGWVINLVVAEWVIRRASSRPTDAAVVRPRAERDRLPLDAITGGEVIDSSHTALTTTPHTAGGR